MPAAGGMERHMGSAGEGEICRPAVGGVWRERSACSFYWPCLRIARSSQDRTVVERDIAMACSKRPEAERASLLLVASRAS